MINLDYNFLLNLPALFILVVAKWRDLGERGIRNYTELSQKQFVPLFYIF